jgi:transposase
MKSERYTFKEFNRQFPDDAACLDYIFDARHPDGGLCQSCGRTNTFHRVATRRCYSCANCGHQIHPCEGTIFHKSSTSLKSWFFAMFLMTSSKNGVSAKELERQLGVTYKTAWRMAHQIRKLMNQGGDMLSGVVEADETYIGGRRSFAHRLENKTIVAGMVERGGDVKAKVVSNVAASSLMPNIVNNVESGSKLFTDEWKGYNYAKKYGYIHATVEHGRDEYVRAEVHTNSIEGFWSQLKRSVNGTFHQVSRSHLQAYVNEFCFRYNHRASVTEAPIFPRLVERVAERRG